MAIQLTNKHHKQLDVFLETALDAYKDGDATRSQAVAVLAQVPTAAAIDNEGEVHAWFDSDQQKRWFREVKNHS